MAVRVEGKAFIRMITPEEYHSHLPKLLELFRADPDIADEAYQIEEAIGPLDNTVKTDISVYRSDSTGRSGVTVESRPFYDSLRDMICSHFSAVPMLTSGAIRAETEMIDDIIKSSNHNDLRRGDVIKGLIDGDGDFCQCGFFFWDGEKVIAPEYNNEEETPDGKLPSEFLIPTEFPITYFDNVPFLETNNSLNFDVETIDKEIEPVFQKIALDVTDGDQAIYKVAMVVGEDDWNVFILVEADDENEEERAAQVYSKFIETGRCSSMRSARVIEGITYDEAFGDIDEERSVFLQDSFSE
jgi:hypothetical protein